MGNDEEEYQEQTEVSRPLLSRLNRLDSLMKRLGGRKNLWANKSSTKDDTNTSADRLDGRCFMPLNVAIQEPCSKGSLLDRIASLEDRLVQLCLEIECYRKSCSSSVYTSSGASSSSNSGSKTERTSSYPTFSSKQNPQCKKQTQVPSSTIPHEFEPQNLKVSSSIKQHPKPQGSSRDKKTGRKGKKKNLAPSWPHLKILGC
ncbi:uncharacterized protein [Coffea arabica]|uniref:Uncharacterized protein n=1 Tax=Coffea arabica TaxID=13443 RepID=A0ABM4VEL5_COFAR